MTDAKTDNFSVNTVTALEIKVAHLEQQISDLSDMVSDQWAIIESLKSNLSRTDAKLESLENRDAGTSENIHDEKPPHY